MQGSAKLTLCETANSHVIQTLVNLDRLSYAPPMADKTSPLLLALIFIWLVPGAARSTEYTSDGYPVWNGAPFCPDLRDALDRQCCTVMMQALASNHRYRMTSWGAVVSIKAAHPPVCPNNYHLSTTTCGGRPIWCEPD